MKKLFLGLFVLFVSMTTVSATSGDYNITLEDVELKNYELGSYDGTLEVNYKLVPIDADNKKVVWSISGLKTGVTASFVNGNETNSSSGKISIKLKNESDEPVKIKLTAKSAGVTKTVEITVEDKEATEKRQIETDVNTVEELIKDLPNTVDKDNVDEVSKTLDKIEKLIKNADVKKLVDKDLLDTYNDVNKFVEEYNRKPSSVGTIIMIAILGLSFIVSLFVIFKKEEKE